MFDIFGEMESAEELNKTAEGLKNEGDKENLYKLADENGIDRAEADLYFEGMTDAFCDVATAAIGKIEVEAAQLKPVEIIADWTAYIKVSCLEDEELARAVRRKGKSLKACIWSILKWSFQSRYKVDKDIVKVAGLDADRRMKSIEMGIPGMGRAKKLIRAYYLESADWMKFINDRALASMHSIFYRAETGVGFCTHCRLHVPVPKNVKHNMQGKCRCGSRITYKSWRKQKSVRYYRVIVSLIQKCTDGQNYVYRQFSVDMYASIKSNYIPEISVHECYRKLFRFYEDGGPLQDAGAYEWGIFRSTGIERWCKAGTVNYGRIYGGGGYAKSFLYTANLNRILKDTCLRYIPVSEIIKQSDDKLNIIAVLGDMGMSFPYEAFWKMGLRKFLIERVKRDGTEGLTKTDYRFDKSPWKYLRITKEHLHQAIRLNAGDKLVRIIQRIDEFGVRITDEQAVWLDKYVGVHVVLGYFGYHTPHRIIRYMQERLCVGTNDNPNHDGSSNLSLWVDYIDTARRLGWNLRDRSIFFPQNVQRAHDEAVRVFDIQKDREDASKMRKKDKIMNQNAKEIKKAFCYRDSNFVIKVPGCYLDFKHEGHAQHNCVATYYERAVEGKCIILFIRQKQCPNKSYCTVEIRNRQGKFHIEQNRAAYNKPAPKAAIVFMEKTVAAAQKIADSMAAEEREQIRIQAAG